MKLLLIISVIIIVLCVVPLCSALIIAGRSDKRADTLYNEGAYEMFRRKQICPKCKTGRDSLRLDEHSEFCPYIGSLKNGRCPFYVPIEEPSKKEHLQDKDNNVDSSEKF